MIELSLEEIKKMSKTDLEAELSNRVYAAAILLEKMENAGRIVGNGHHKAQTVVARAIEEMRFAWRK